MSGLPVRFLLEYRRTILSFLGKAYLLGWNDQAMWVAVQHLPHGTHDLDAVEALSGLVGDQVVMMSRPTAGGQLRVRIAQYVLVENDVGLCWARFPSLTDEGQRVKYVLGLGTLQPEIWPEVAAQGGLLLGPAQGDA